MSSTESIAELEMVAAALDANRAHERLLLRKRRIAIDRARKDGINQTAIARALGIHRNRLAQILREGAHGAQ